MSDMAGHTQIDEDDPLEKLERLVNARTARMAADAERRRAVDAERRETPPVSDPAPAAPVQREEPQGLVPELAAELAALTETDVKAEPKREAVDAAVPDLDTMPLLPSLAALRGGFAADPEAAAAPTDATAVEETPAMQSRSRPPFPNPVALEIEADAELDDFDSAMDGAVEMALAAAGAAVAVTASKRLSPELPSATHPLELPKLPAFDGETAAAASEADLLTAFERELADEVYHIDEPVASVSDPLVGPVAMPTGPSADDFERLVVPAANDNRARKRAAMVAALVGGVAVMGALGSLTLGGGVGGSTEVAVVRAEATPYKKKPENAGGIQVANQDNPVYEKVATATGAKALAKRETTLVNRAEDVSDVRVSSIPGAAAKAGDRLYSAGIDVSPGGSGAVAPRAVRTIQVGPDGKLVGSEPAPVAVAKVDPVEAIVPEAETPSTPDIDPVTVASINPTGALEIGGVPVPLGRPAGGRPAPVPETASASPDASTSAAPAATAPSPTVPPVVGEYVVQIASVPSAEAARQTYASLSSQFAGIIGGRGVDYQVAEIDGRGTYHRVRIPAGSKGDANDLCASFKAAGGSCFVTR